MSAQSTIATLSAIFARFGAAVEVCTDNGPQFSSHEFLLFSRRYDFTHVTSSPHYPQSNGLAEKGVQAVKRIMKKTADSGDDFWLGLLAYRSTPLEDGRSPGELLQRRRLRANLPDFSTVTATDVKKHSQAQGGRPLPPLQKGVVVRHQRRCMVPQSSSGGFAICKVLPCQNGGPEAVKVPPSSPTSNWRMVHRGKRRRH
nr:uncharacterized protein K02A2.6-like [Rhipicephalus microplus]